MAALLLLVAGCANDPSLIGKAATVIAFDGAPMYYLPSDDQRVRYQPVTFPDAGLYDQIVLKLGVRCPPSGGCDHWDRIGTLSIVEDVDPQTGEETLTEIWRFITPYRIGAAWELDVTDLRPALSGDKTLRVYISTGVGPGHPNGSGWLFDATFEFRGGIPERIPLAVHPLWQTNVNVGHPDEGIETFAPPREVTVAKNARVAQIRAFITGHGQGNAGNCAEFCRKDHSFTLVDGENTSTVERDIWRNDCAWTAVPGQYGTYTYPRAGWCPGASAYEWTENLSDAVSPGAALTVRYGIDAYENTCRPDAPEAPNCLGCTLGNGCDYNGSNHTRPRYIMSASLITFE